MATERTMTFGVVVGNRGFFPSHLAKSGREEIISVLEAAGARAIVLGPEDSVHGAVETYTEAQRCAELFKKHAEEIDGILVTLPKEITEDNVLASQETVKSVAAQINSIKAAFDQLQAAKPAKKGKGKKK